jgi:hypothetical protein
MTNWRNRQIPFGGDMTLGELLIEATKELIEGRKAKAAKD